MTAINENGQLYWTFETALEMSNGFMEEAQRLQKDIYRLMRERKAKEETLSYEEWHVYSAQIEDLFNQKELLYKESNKYIKLSLELFKQAVS